MVVGSGSSAGDAARDLACQVLDRLRAGGQTVAVAESLTGWPASEAMGHHLDEIFPIVNADTRIAVESPVSKVLRLGTSIGLAYSRSIRSRTRRSRARLASSSGVMLPA